MLRFYRAISTLLFPLIWCYMQLRLSKGKEDETRIKERFGKAALPRPEGKLVWIHGASVGESNSVIPLMNALHEAYPALNILLTTGTTSSAKTIQGRLPERAFHQFIPVDVPHLIDRFLKHWQPDAAVWVESELWPNLVLKTHARGVPMALINARMSSKSHAKWLRFRQSFLQLMNCFSILYAGSPDDARKYKNLGAPDVRQVGNLKYDAPNLPADPEVTSQILSKIGDRRIWLASSTHPGEEMFIATAHKRLKETFPDLLTLLVPRHATRGQEIIDELIQHKLTVSCRSKDQPILPETDIYVADTMGELGIFYRLSGIAFIGGSLVPHGGHNPIEPAQLDCALLCGPHMQNFRGIERELQEAEALIEVKDEDELAHEVEELLRDHDLQEQRAKYGHDLVESKRGVVNVLLKEIALLLLQLPMQEEEIEEETDDLSEVS